MKLVPDFLKKKEKVDLTGNSIGVELPFDLKDLNNRLGGIYRKQQSQFQVHQIRYFAEADGYAYKIVDLMINHLIGAKGVAVDFGNDRLNNMWLEWRPSPQFPEIDFAEIMRFMVLSIIRDGESITQTFWDSKGFYVEPIDPLDLPLDNIRILEGPNVMVQSVTNSGIDFDRYRRPVRYHFRPEIGGPWYDLPADQVTHLFLRKYAGQTRGLSWFLGAIDTMRDLHDFEKNISTAIKNAAADPGFYKIPPRLFPAISPGDIDTTSPESVKSSASRVLQTMLGIAPDRRGFLPSDVEFQGTHIGNVFQGPVAAAYREASLSRIAACVGLSYASVSGDLAQANYSSLQQGHLQDRALYRRTQAELLGGMRRIVRAWLQWNGLKSRRLEAMCANCEPKYLFPPFEALDRVKDAQANKIMLEQNIISPSTLIQGLGQDPDATFRQIAKDQAMIEKYKQDEMALLGLNIQDMRGNNPNDDNAQQQEKNTR